MALDLVPLLPADLQSSLDRLRKLNTQNIQTEWQYLLETPKDKLTPTDLFATATALHWPLASLNDRQHIAWDKGLQILWLHQIIEVPAHLQGYPLSGLILRLSLTWWAEDAQIYVDGALVQSGDLFECFTRLCLSESVQIGQTFQVAVRLVSPNHDNGALVRSHLTYELPPHHPTPEPSFIADELTVLATLEPDSQPEIKAAIAHLPWSTLSLSSSHSHQTALDLWDTLSSQVAIPASVHPFQQSLSDLRRDLKHYSLKLKARQIQCVGHAHLDMAWLWPISDTWEAAERTFRSILNLQADFPDLTYTHSSPALFEWLEHNRPELFSQIQSKVEEGSWSIDAGLWIEPELNIISGESIVRQILYGQRYCQEKFGKISKIAWLPDSFGFCWQLPQLLTQGGIQTFATLKLSWNDTTDFPHSLFWWQSPDGSRILSLMLPPIGTDIDPIKMSTHAKNWEDHTGITDTLWLPGLGDHGGGPTRDMLEKAGRWQKSPFFPELNFTTPNQYIESLAHSSTPLLPNKSPSDQVSSQDSLPIWESDLYLELHRGCYTTHADQKQSNRQSEDLLYQAEVFATIAQITANCSYPKTDIEAAWKILLFNQFHDILPGTSIPEVFEKANNGWQQVQQIGQSVLDESLKAIASTIQFPSPPHREAKPILVFNPLTWSRDAVISFDLSKIDPEKKQLDWIVYDPNYQVIPSQNAPELSNKKAPHQISFLASDIPSLGYQCYWIRPTNTPNDSPRLTKYVLENEFLRVCVDSLTGQIASLIEKSTQTEAFSSLGNQLQLFRDQSGYWDAWNIAPNYEEHPLHSLELFSVQWHETGPIRQCIRVTYKTEVSLIEQDYILDAATPFLVVSNRIIWAETQVLLKVNFPLTVSSDVATYEIPFGAITRKTIPQTAAEKAQWEVPALCWADIGDQNFGISILTTCKHGFDVSSNHIRLTLLKSSIWPDPTADRGTHRFTYAIYPHRKTWQQARTVHYARELSLPPIVYQPEASIAQLKEKNPNQHSFLTIRNPNVIMSTFKPAEDNPNEFILRFYEALGVSTHLELEQSLELSTALKRGNRTNLLETAVQHQHPTYIRPYQIATYRLKRKVNHS
ncbi:glycosyl hydrolases family 38 N-terminal domain [Synechococcus sp. PCC 7335]|uniref:alpha-mannosidase n=1 Tax=Synechococcus sp. (strain ATCC 29403 / PCC 7335) TaxID=91464 RepID=UPI00017EE7A5|nr:alpha-mannosidase [Synechococcus sp. PCC 7335]EDX85862.1 glycosyl hydrolases family 38 N-terminal domain [Synechococcus sp. PCC 7335]